MFPNFAELAETAGQLGTAAGDMAARLARIEQLLRMELILLTRILSPDDGDRAAQAYLDARAIVVGNRDFPPSDDLADGDHFAGMPDTGRDDRYSNAEHNAELPDGGGES
jgi:hypothetical protein